MRIRTLTLATLAVLGLAAPAWAQTESNTNSGGSRWQNDNSRRRDNSSNDRWQQNRPAEARAAEAAAEARAAEQTAEAAEEVAEAAEEAAEAAANTAEEAAEAAASATADAPEAPASSTSYRTRWGDSPNFRYNYSYRTSDRRHRRNNTRYLFQDSDVGAFGTVLFEVGQVVDGEIGTFTGGGGALIFNDNFFIGGYGLNFIGGLPNVPQEAKDVHGDNTSFEMRHGGFWLGGNIHPQSAIHPSWGLKLGWGRAKWNDGRGGISAEDRFFAVQPSIGIQANLLSWMRLNIEGSYRYLTGLNLPGSQSTDLNGFSGTLGLSFGGWD